MVTAAGSAPAGVFVFIKAALTVLVETMVPVIIVFAKAVLAALVEAMVPVIMVFVKAVLTAFVKATVPVIIVFVKAALMVFVEAAALVTVVFVKAVLAVFFQALAFFSVMVTEGRGTFSVSAAFIGVIGFPGTGDRIFLFFLQCLMNDRAPGIFRIDLIKAMR